MAQAYSDFARVYDELMDNTPYESWCDNIAALMEQYGVTVPIRDNGGQNKALCREAALEETLASERNLVLDLGCGTGTLTELLYQKGYDMIGVDNSLEMLEIAREKQEKSGSEIMYIQQDMRELELYSTVGTVISVCDSLNYLLTEEDLLTVFCLVNNYLYPGGLFLFDFNTVYKYSQVIGDATIAENREDCSFIWENYYHEEEEINEYDLTVFVQEEGDCFRRFTENHFQRGYTPETMCRLVEQAGMQVIRLLDADTLGEVTAESERVYVLAREYGKFSPRLEVGMNDYIVRATAAGAQIRAFAATTRNLVEEARAAHNTSPVMTAALGRLLTAGAMMGIMLKGDKDLLTLQIRGNGPGRGLTVTADSQGRVKGYPLVADVILPANDRGKLDVAGALGTGILSVIRDMGLKEPYVGQTPLQTGEIAEDLTYYFATSEQVPSSVGLGVLMERDNTVKQAGGFILQLMPYTEEAVIARLEENLSKVSSVTTLLEEGNTPEQILQLLLEGLEVEITDTMETGFVCNCDKSRVEKALISIGEGELQEMIDEGKEIEVNCQFCNRHYLFSVEELKSLHTKAKKARLRD